jgi:hypothetical protein
MRKRRLPVARTLIAAYRDLGRLLSTMPGLMVRAFLIILAVAASTELLPERLWDGPLGGEAMGLAQNAIELFLLTPVFMAIHRLVILNKITRHYTLPAGEPGFGLFFCWLFGLMVLVGLPLDTLDLLQLDWPLWATMLAFAVALIAAFTLAFRLMILLPALAVGASGAIASRALADSKGNGLRLFAVVFLALAPWFAVSYGGAILLGRGAMIAGSGLGMVFLAVSAILQTIILSLTALSASYAFIALAEQVKRRARSEAQSA